MQEWQFVSDSFSSLPRSNDSRVRQGKLAMTAGTISKPSAELCREKKELQEDISMAARVIIDLCQCEAEAAEAREFAKLKIVRAEIQAARRWKDSMVVRLYSHIRAHHC